LVLQRTAAKTRRYREEDRSRQSIIADQINAPVVRSDLARFVSHFQTNKWRKKKDRKSKSFADPRPDGSCVDVVRVRDRGSTLFEFCGTAAGARVVSTSNMLTLDLVASRRLYSARGFLLQYQGEQRYLLESVLSFRVLLFLCPFSYVWCTN